MIGLRMGRDPHAPFASLRSSAQPRCPHTRHVHTHTITLTFTSKTEYTSLIRINHRCTYHTL